MNTMLFRVIAQMPISDQLKNKFPSFIGKELDKVLQEFNFDITNEDSIDIDIIAEIISERLKMHISNIHKNENKL